MDIKYVAQYLYLFWLMEVSSTSGLLKLSAYSILLRNDCA